MAGFGACLIARREESGQGPRPGLRACDRLVRTRGETGPVWRIPTPQVILARRAVFVGIVVLHVIFFWALKQGLVRAGIQVVQDFSIMDLPPPPPPPENLDEPPPPPPVDVPPPVVPPPLIDLPAFEGPTTAITAKVQETPRAQPQTPARQVTDHAAAIQVAQRSHQRGHRRLLSVGFAPPQRGGPRRRDHRGRRGWQGGYSHGDAEQRLPASRWRDRMRRAPAAIRAGQARRPAGRSAGLGADRVQAGVTGRRIVRTGEAQGRDRRRRLSGKYSLLEGLQNGW